MGNGVLTKVTQAVGAVTGDKFNEIIDAIQRHFLPRDDNGNLSAGEQDLGSGVYPWRDVHAKRFYADGELLTASGGGVAGSSRIAPGIRHRGAGGYVLSARANNDGAPSFLLPNANAGVRVYASSANPLRVVYRDGTSRDVVASIDIALPAHTRGAGSANTAQIDMPDAEVASIPTRYWEMRAMGYFGTRTPLTAVGARWTQEQDEWMAFSPNEAGGDMGICRVISRGGLVFLTDAWRGFFGKRGAGVDQYVDGAIQAINNNATLNFANINYVFLQKDGTAYVHNKDLFYAASPLLYKRAVATGDIRLNGQEGMWEIATVTSDETTWAEMDAVLLGVAASNAAGGCDFARGVWDDAALKLFAAAPVFAGGRLASDDSTKWEPSFSPHNKLAGGLAIALAQIQQAVASRLTSSGYGNFSQIAAAAAAAAAAADAAADAAAAAADAAAAAAIQTAVRNSVYSNYRGFGYSVGYSNSAADAAAAAAAVVADAVADAAAADAAAADAAEDVVLNPVLQVKFGSPAGGAKVPMDWVITQCYAFSSPINFYERYDDRGGGRPAPIQADVSGLPSVVAGERRVIYSDSDFNNVVAENATPPLMLECPGRQLFVHPHKTKTALCSAFGGAIEWEFRNIRSFGGAAAAGTPSGIRENARVGTPYTYPLYTAFQQAVAGHSFGYVRRGRVARLTLLGEWGVFLGQDNVVPDAAGEWGREITSGYWIELFNTPKAGTGDAITQSGYQVIPLFGDDTEVTNKTLYTLTYRSAASGEFAANTLTLASPYGNAVIPNGVTTVKLYRYGFGE